MKKGVIIVLAVAIIGILGVAAKSHGSQGTAPAAGTASGRTIGASTPMQPAADAGTSSTAGMSSSGSYKDGTYTGNSEDTLYGTVQVAAVISGGKITDIQFLQMPGPEGNSRQITSFSEPILKQETIEAQAANIDFVSGATQTSEAYEQSLQAALDQAALG